jgi:CBS domain-containing protein
MCETANTPSLERSLANLAARLVEVATAVRAARDVDAVVAAAGPFRLLVDDLVAEQAPAAAITRVVTGHNDRVTRRLIEIMGLDAELAAAQGCWIALGSQGRGEQTLATDQDNAIVLAATEERTAARLLPLAQRVNDALDRCGYALCRGGVMAGNPQWCLSVEQWRERFGRWIDEPDPQALLNATIFFDFRAVSGAGEVVAQLRAWLAGYAQERGPFLLSMARNALANAPALGVVRDFVLAGNGDHAGTLDLKVNGVQLFVEAVRVYGLAAGVAATHTVERLAALGAARKLPYADVAAWTAAFDFVQRLRLVLNAAQRARGEPLHNHLDPAALNEFDRRILKEALRQGRLLQSRLSRDFSLAGAAFGA